MAEALRITDPADPRIAVFRDIRERDLVGRQGVFIAEGEVVLRTLLGSARHRVQCVLIDEKRQEALASVLERRGDAVPLYVAPRGVLDGIAGFPLHRGILAVGECGPALTAAELLAPAGERTILALSGIANHDNMGGIFRNAAAFGAAGILLGDDCCDPYYRKAIRVSVGTTLTLPFAKLEAGEDLVTTLAAAGYEVLTLSPAGREALTPGMGGGRIAAVLGAEGPGLPAEILARTRAVRIPMAEGVDSLNVATTSGIVLFALSQRRS